MFLYFQNAWQTECPEEMVGVISMEIPPGMDVENPLEDAAFLEQIGAKRIDNVYGEPWIEYELKNVATGTQFTFMWAKIESEPESWWSLEREDEEDESDSEAKE